MLQDLIVSLQISEYVRCYFLGAIWCYWWSGIAKNRYFIWWAKISCGICYCHIYQAAFDYSGWALKSFRFRCVVCTFLVRFIRCVPQYVQFCLLGAYIFHIYSIYHNICRALIMAETVEALIMAINKFEGGIVMVSHDQHLLQSCIDDYWAVYERKVRFFDTFEKAKIFSLHKK